MIYILYYDSNCPICSSFARLLKGKLDRTRINVVALASDASDFKLKTPRGAEYVGKEALDILLREFPEVKSFFWMLPTGMRSNAVKATVSVAKSARNLIGSLTKRPCNCGKR